MSLKELLPLALNLSIVLIVLALGLTAPLGAARNLLRRHGLLLRSLAALLLLVPIATAIVLLVFDPVPPIKVALMLLAISPIPPLLPGKQLKLSEDRSYIYGLLVIISIISIVYIPIAVRVIGGLLETSATMPASAVLKVIGLSVLAPLAIGMIVRATVPTIAARIAPVAKKAGGAMLGILAILMLVMNWQRILELLGDGTAAIIALVVALSLAIGHLLGGPDDDDRVALALAASAHHPGLALAMASVNVPGHPDVAAAILLYLLLNVLFTIPYTAWRKRSLKQSGPRIHDQQLTLKRTR